VTKRFVLGVLLLGCTREPSEPSKKEILRIEELPKPEPPDCLAQQYRVSTEMTGVVGAKDHVERKRAAITAANATSPGCRSGSWYLDVSRLLDLGAQLELAGLHFATPEEALAAALQQPDDVNVLVRVTQVAAFGRKVTPPSDACERARRVVGVLERGSDRDRIEARVADEGAHYICARAAIEGGDGKRALAELAAVDPRTFVDFELARAQAFKLVGNRALTIRHARAAITTANEARIVTADRDAIIRLAEPLTASTRVTSP
jgi:hypothetical protein